MYIITPKNDSGKVRVRFGKVACGCMFLCYQKSAHAMYPFKERKLFSILLSNNVEKPSVYI